VDANDGPPVVGRKATCTVQDAAVASVGELEPQGLDPPFNVNANGEPVGASREIDETLSCAVPVFVFVMVTSNGAGVLPGVTLPKSKAAGKTWIAGLPAGGGGGLGAGAGAGVGLLPPPELQPVATKAAVANNAAREVKRPFIVPPIFRTSDPAICPTGDKTARRAPDNDSCFRAASPPVSRLLLTDAVADRCRIASRANFVPKISVLGDVHCPGRDPLRPEQLCISHPETRKGRTRRPFGVWWRRRELNPRPRMIQIQFYMRSRSI